MPRITLFAILLIIAIVVSTGYTPAESWRNATTRRARFDGGIATQALQTGPADNDHDGIDDGLEQLLAERYAPMVYLEPAESNYPVNADWIAQRGHLWYGEQGCHFPVPDQNEQFLAPIGTQDRLLGAQGAAGPSWVHPSSFGAGHHQGHCDEFQSADPVVLSTTD